MESGDEESDDSGDVVSKLPGDVYPAYIVNYLQRYEISVGEAVERNVRWDNFREQLVFPYYSYRGPRRLVCIQARNFNKERASKAKYFNKGSASETLPIFHYKGESKSNDVPTIIADDGISGHSSYTSKYSVETINLHRGGFSTVRKRQLLVITEDALSAIKIARQSDAMPCLGTYLPKDKIIALRALYEAVIVWLDRDKWREARAIADCFKLVGVSATTLLTDLDPKCYTDSEIQEFLYESK